MYIQETTSLDTVVWEDVFKRDADTEPSFGELDKRDADAEPWGRYKRDAVAGNYFFKQFNR
jgi:hypothetical protein